MDLAHLEASPGISGIARILIICKQDMQNANVVNYKDCVKSTMLALKYDKERSEFESTILN